MNQILKFDIFFYSLKFDMGSCTKTFVWPIQLTEKDQSKDIFLTNYFKIFKTIFADLFSIVFYGNFRKYFFLTINWFNI